MRFLCEKSIALALGGIDRSTVFDLWKDAIASSNCFASIFVVSAEGSGIP